VDPAVVNLTQFETFFEERRPFFTEGAKVFGDFGRSGASQYWGFFRPEPTLYYSRRIGRAPQGKPSGTWVDTPTATTILGAAKVVGRTHKAGPSRPRGRHRPRARQDIQRGRDRRARGGAAHELRRDPRPARVGPARCHRVLGTSVIRDLSDPALAAYLTDRALMLGVDGHYFLDGGRKWVVHGGIAGSSVHGSTQAITRLQKAEQRYYQRPDVTFVKLDPTATSMSGWNGRRTSTATAGTSP